MIATLEEIARWAIQLEKDLGFSRREAASACRLHVMSYRHVIGTSKRHGRPLPYAINAVADWLRSHGRGTPSFIAGGEPGA